MHFVGPIYSIACHPSGQRFATCGSDNKIKIWSLKPLLSARERDLESAPRQLATLTDSISPVNVVRFSHCGRWLASGEAPCPPPGIGCSMIYLCYIVAAAAGQHVLRSSQVTSERFVVLPSVDLRGTVQLNATCRSSCQTMWLPLQQCSQVQVQGGTDAGVGLLPCRLWQQVCPPEVAKSPHMRCLRVQALMMSLGKLMRSCGSLLLHFCGPAQLQWNSATGSDDKVVLLYELKGGKAVAAFGSSDGPNLENWRASKQLRGHDNQVGP